MKRILITALITLCTASSSFAATNASRCSIALPDDQAGFCPSFKTVATCQCVERGLPKAMCQDMDTLYRRMLSMFGTLQKACEYQHDTTTQTCVDSWNCYRMGGKDSQGRLCSATGKSCS